MRIPLFKLIARNYDKAILVLILLIASFVRLYRIMDYITFLGDEGRDVMVVYRILHGDFTLLGPTASVGGFFLGPIYYYFMAPFLWLFNYNPVGPAIMVAIFGIATVWLIYKIGKEFFGASVGLIASGLYAISPLVIIYSRSSWNPNLVPFFSLLTLYVTYKALKNNSIKLLVLAGVLFGILMQLHYLAIFLGVIVGAYILLLRFTFSISDIFPAILKQYLYLLLGFTIGWSPFLLFEIRHDFLNIISIFNFVTHSGDTGGGIHFFDTINNVFFRIFARLVANFPTPEKMSTVAEANIKLWENASLLLGLSGIFILVLKCVKSYIRRSNDFAKYSLFLLWLLIGVGFFGFYKKSIYDYYFGFMFPLPFLIIGILIKSLWTNKIGKFLSILILLILVWLNSLNPPYKAPANKQLNQAEEISKFVIDKTNNKPFNFALITGGNSDHAYRYFFTVWQKEPITIETMEKDPDRKTVTNQLLVVCEEAVCEPLGHPIWEIAGFGKAEIVDKWDVSVVKVYKLKRSDSN
ncbi:MAG: glycosyltransferase family 39 protein [Candidatus Levybacteria bacterium]|nr:glycosyltransferase family 39 protein [Candidatus Levybacteria bacterium]